MVLPVSNARLLLIVVPASMILIAGLYTLLAGFRERPQRRRLPSRLRLLDPRAAIAQRKRLAVALAVGIAAGLYTGWPVAVVAGALGCWHLPRLLGNDSAETARIARVEAVAVWTEMLRDTLTAAAGLEQAVLASTSVAPAMLREPLWRLGAALRARASLPQALAALAEELADPIVDQVVVCLIHAHSKQAKNLAALLGELSEAARAQVMLATRVHAERAKHRTSMRTISGISISLAVGLAVFYPPFVAPYGTAAGQGVLAVVVGLFVLAFTMMRRIFRPRPMPRLLAVAEMTEAM